MQVWAQMELKIEADVKVGDRYKDHTNMTQQLIEVADVLEFKSLYKMMLFDM